MDPVARRYAQALSHEARSQGSLDTIDGDVDTIAATLEGARDLRQALASPIVSRDRKEAILTSLFSGSVSKLTLDFLHLLLRKGREDGIVGVVAGYQALRDEERGVVTAQVRSAKPLDPSETERLKAALEASSGKTVRMTLTVEPELIGGLVVRLGDTVYDRSVRHQLAELKDQMVASAYARTN